ncbi:MAG: PAS domain-containing protein [Campylobacterota bacterium]
MINNTDGIVQATPTDKEITVFNESVFIVETDLEGNMVYANRRYIALLGFSEEELMGQSYHMVWHPDMPKGVLKAMWKIITTGTIWRGYLKHLCKDGSYFWTLSYMHAKFNDDGKIIGYSSTGKVAHESSRIEVEKKYKELSDDIHIDDEYFMSSENYYETQILPKAYYNEFPEEK